MGLLDDAIREHLELKRQRGADASEVAKQEHEAFGPIQRPAPAARENASPAGEPDPAPAAPGDDPTTVFDAPLARAHDALHDDDDVPPPAPAPGGAVRAEFPDEDVAPPERPRGGAVRAQLPDDLPPPAPAAPGPLDDLEWSEPARPSRAPEGDALERAGQPTAEYDVEDLERLRTGAGDDAEPDVVPADEDPDGEDVLEETPEFLSETPEHDRLWFEQRPPRDFDF